MKEFPRSVIWVIWAGFLLSSCGDREPKVAIPIEFFEEVADRNDFEKWTINLIKETCFCRAFFEDGNVMVPESKKEQVIKALQLWSGADAIAVSFHVGHPDQDPPLPDGAISVSFRHDPERKGIVDQDSIMNNAPIGIKNARAFFGPGGWWIYVDFDPATSKLMDEYTTANSGNQMAILLNGKILSMPVIREPFSSGCSITGNFTEEEAKVLAIGFQDSPPVKFRIPAK